VRGPGSYRLVGAGAFDTAANVCVAFATTKGAAGIVVVLSALYPVVTVVLARLVSPNDSASLVEPEASLHLQAPPWSPPADLSSRGG
jgi:hypothetical protein